MSKNHSPILYQVLCIILLTGCKPVYIPIAYQHSLWENKTGISGGWVTVKYHNPLAENTLQSVKGELIAMQSDSFYVLTESLLVPIDTHNIDTAVLYIFKNQTGKYLMVTSLLLLPNIIATIGYGEPAYLLFAVPWAITGFFSSIIEASGSNYRMRYPEKNSLRQFGKFVRFPVGIPSAMNREELKLITGITKKRK